MDGESLDEGRNERVLGTDGGLVGWVWWVCGCIGRAGGCGGMGRVRR